jgi:hypothetical protein
LVDLTLRMVYPKLSKIFQHSIPQSGIALIFGSGFSTYIKSLIGIFG